MDNFTGTTGNDTFIGDNTQTNGSVGAGDQLNGGTGTDTFNYFVAAAGGAVVAPQLNSVENVNLVGTTTAGITTNLTNAVGLQQVTLKDTTTTGSVITVGAGVAAGLDNAKITGVATFTGTATQTAATLNVVNGSNVTTVNVDGVAITTLNVVSAAGAANTIGALASTGNETTLNVSGAGNITINGVGTTLTTINAAAATGTTSIDASATVGNVTYTGGTGNDTIKLGGSLTIGDVVNGGTGVNTLGVTVGSTLVTGLQVSNIQTLDVGGSNSGTGVAASSNIYDLSKLAGITTLKVGSIINDDLAPIADDVTTINNLAKGAVVEINAALGTGAGDQLVVNVKDAGAGSPSDVIGVTVSGATAVTTAGDLVIADIETVNLTSSTTAITPVTHTISALNVNQALTVAVANGNAALTITDLNATSLVLFDATAATKVVSATTAGGTAFSATNGIAFKLGAGADVLDLTGSISAGTLTGSKFIVTGNGGGDTITLTAATIDPDAGGGLGAIGNQETVVYLAAADSQAGLTVAGVNKFDTLNNFDAEIIVTPTQDFIDLKAFSFTSTQAAAFAKVVGTAITANGDVAAADANTFFVNAGAKIAVAVVGSGGDTWLFIDADKDGNYSAATDMAIKLVGVTSTDVTSADFTFA